MSEELFDVFDEHNETYLGQVPRSEVHRTGQYHRAVNVILLNSAGDILVQKRSPSKVVCPNKWDLSCAEHLTHLEEYSHGAARGLKEELNILVGIDKLTRIREAKLHCNDNDELNIHDHEFTELYTVVYDGEYTVDGDEVTEAKFVSRDELRKQLESSPDDFTTWARQELEYYFSK